MFFTPRPCCGREPPRVERGGFDESVQRLGELGLIMLPMFTLPPPAALWAAADILASEILQDVDRPSARTLRYSGWA